MSLDWTNKVNNVDDVDAGDVNSLAAAILDLEQGKVDKVSGKGLSTNDYTTAEKEKLEDLENYDDTAVRTDISNLQTGLGLVIQGKQDKEAGKGLSTNDYTTAEKEKLATAVTYNSKIGQHSPGIVSANDLFYATDGIPEYGYIIATIKSYAAYITKQLPLSENAFVSIGTLRNVIAGTIEDNKLVPVITTSTATAGTTLEMNTLDGKDMRYTASGIGVIVLSFTSDEYANDYAMSFNFNSGSTPTTIAYDTPIRGEFSTSETYAVGDIVLYSDILWKCINAVTTAGAWDADYWVETTVYPIINWVGEDCSMSGTISLFTPQANKHYEVIIYFNGSQFVGEVAGYVTATGNVVLL